MNTKEEEFLKRLRETFRIEAEEHIRGLTSGLIELEKTPKTEKKPELVESIFREAHSLKGAARSVNMKDVESVCHELESIFGKLKKEEMTLTAGQFDIIHSAIDSISKMVSNTDTKNPADNRELMIQLRSIHTSEEPKIISQVQNTSVKEPIKESAKETLPINGVSVSSEPEDRPIQIETVRIPTSKLDPLFLEAEQMIQSKIAATQRTIELKNIRDLIESWKIESKKRDTHPSIESGHQFKEFNDWNIDKLKELEQNVNVVTTSFENDWRLLGRIIDEHVDSMKNILILPVSSIIEGFQKFVRDLARSQGKDVDLIVNGSDIEVDKRILEELKDPLIHLIRNCIDHGIQKPSEREKINKPGSGKILLNFSATESRHLEIIISDNGSGINSELVRNAAIKAGVISKDSLEKLNPQETQMLIFQSGISTSKIITDLSGRGLGLAIVQEKVEKLGGTVSVESQPNIGTKFRLLLPLTLSTFRGVLIRAGEHIFAIPSTNVERVIRVPREEIKTVENRETVMAGGKIMPVVNFGAAMGLSGRNIKSEKKANVPESHQNFIQLLIITYADKRIAFDVDEIIDEYQILVKELGKQLKRVRNISGATVLGSGKVVPVINVPDLMKSAMKPELSVKETIDEETEKGKIYNILVVDDSITSRSLIKDIVQTAGYNVETAVDGVDAFTKAAVGEFDLIVSDVDMPRMNGFELTTKIRKNKKLNELPVVLVTALESREDRELGIDVGADAYIVKSSFDQSNLLEVINRLL